MHGYKYALIGDAVFAAIGLVLTLLFLPHVKPNMSTQTHSLEEGGIPANMEDSKVVSSDQGKPPQKQEAIESPPQKQEVGELSDTKEELDD